MTTPSVREAAAAIDGLLPALDRPIDGMSREQVIAQALVRRGRHLYRSANRNLDEGDAIAAGVLVRSLMDLLILVRWAEDDPENHIEMWIAEDQRQRATGAEKHRELRQRRGWLRGDEIPQSDIEAWRADVARVREAALARNEPGVGERGSVVPGLETMSQCADDLWEVYQVAFRVLSDIAHSGGRSFVRDGVEVRGAETHIVSAPPFSVDDIRVLTIPGMLMLLASASRQLGLDIEGDCQRILTSFHAAGASSA